MLFTTLAGLAGSIGVLRRQASPAQRATATACLLTFLSAVAVLLMSDVFEFSWRYQLPALVTLPPAGALGLTVIAGYVAARRQRATPPVSGPARRPSLRARAGPARVPAEGPGLRGLSRYHAGRRLIAPPCGQPGRGPNRAEANHTTSASGTSTTIGSSAGR